MADHEHSVIKHSDHLLLDQPLLRLPYELLRNNFRSAHFAVEKENAGIKTLLKDAATGCLNGRSSPSDLVHSLDDMISQARALKRKLSTCAEDEARLLRQTEARIAHVDELYHMSSFDDVKYESWSRTRLDRLLVDYLLRRGYSDSATALAEERNMRDLVDVETFVTMARIIASLKAGSVQEALAWCTENKKELRKMDVS
jgi:macrophage erythroblast attacher